MKTINNNIEEPICSLEISKLLKEKGFDVPCYHSYTITKDSEINLGYKENKSNNYSDGGSIKEENSDIIPAPTHALAKEWIRENFGIHIYFDYYNKGIYFGAFRSKEGSKKENFKHFATPKEAEESAIEYVLIKLAKHDS